MEMLIQLVLGLMALFIILLVLVQRGRGGGLAGALGGPGGSSAFGAKAGDTFTKITVWTITIWIITCVLATYWSSHRGDAFGTGEGNLAGSSAETALETLDAPAATEEAPPSETAAPATTDTAE